MSKRWSALSFAVLAAAAPWAGACALDAQVAGATGSFDRTLVVSAPVDLSVRTGSGSIDVQAGPADSVHIIGHIRARGVLWSGVAATEQVERLEANPPIVQNGDSIQVGEISDLILRQNVSISYEITVPPETQLRSKTGSGSQSIGDIRGPLEAEAGSGSIRAGRIGGFVSASTGSGRVELLGSNGVNASTGSGSIHAEQVSGPIKAKAGSGRIDLLQTGPGDVDVSTGSGRITVGGVQGAVRLRAGSGDILVEGQPLHDWTVHTGSGSVTLRVPSSAAFDLDAQTGSGSVHSTHGLEVFGKLSTHRLQAKMGGGGAHLEVSTSSGNIRIE